MGRPARRETGQFLKSFNGKEFCHQLHYVLIPGISSFNKLKVEKTNELYRFTFEILASLERRKVAIVSKTVLPVLTPSDDEVLKRFFQDRMVSSPLS